VPRAAVCHAFDRPLVVEPVELDAPGDGELLVDVRACALCHSDLAYARGAWGGALPAVYGHEAAGVVQAVGPGVEAPAPGEHVIVTLVRHCGACPRCRAGEPVLCEGAFRLDAESPIRLRDGRRAHQGMRCGALADAVLVHASQALAVPADVPFASAAVIGCAVLTGLGAVERVADVRAGQAVAVVGAGGVGLNIVQAAAARGASPLLAVDPAPAKLGAARLFGATAALEPGAQARSVLADATASAGADVVFVAAAAAEAIEAGLALARRGGTVVLVGMPPAGVTARLDAAALAHDAKRVVGCKLGNARPAEDVPRIVERYRAGRLRLDELVSATWPLEAIEEAMASARRADALRNVVVP
jgi:S-(hydroxymethyl)glutathione dehydrogenase / alcohol dehydrogenase